MIAFGDMYIVLLPIIHFGFCSINHCSSCFRDHYRYTCTPTYTQKRKLHRDDDIMMIKHRLHENITTIPMILRIPDT